jgi:diadenosine tetraphosphate (Ap4A) HIT family hydrolase
MTCELVEQRRAGKAPLWDCIYQTKYWDVAHSYNTSLPGWLVLVTRRHITALDELTEEEAYELGDLIRRCSKALKVTTGCVKTYVAQFAEQAEHPHVHFHIVPRMADQPEERTGVEVFNYLCVSDEERVSEEKMTDLAAKIRAELLSR